MSIFKSAVEKPITTMMVFVAIMVLGIFSYVSLPVDQYPKMDPPYLTVMATYPGASASDIEENVTKILEDNLNSVDDLKEIKSISYENLGVITLEFEWEANLDEASNDVRDAVDKAMNKLPDDIDRPTIMKFNTSMMPILIYSITAKESFPGLDKILDDKLITRLNQIDGMASVTLAGAPERVIYVDLDPIKLDAYNLTIEQIGKKIMAENSDISSGNIKMTQMDYSVRVEGEFEESDEINDIPLGLVNGKTIYIKDIAQIRDTIKDITLEQKINRGDGGILLITKQSDANAVSVAKEAKKVVERMEKELPSDIKFNIISDNSDFIIRSINNCSCIIHAQEQNSIPVQKRDSVSVLMPDSANIQKQDSAVPVKKTKVYLEHAKTLSFDQEVRPDAQILIGDVCFRHDSSYMYCDSAHFYEKTNSLEAFSNVRMEQGDTLFVYGQYLFYDGNTQIARLRDLVRMENKQVTLFTDSLNYERIPNIGYYFEGGMIVDSLNQLSSFYGRTVLAIE